MSRSSRIAAVALVGLPFAPRAQTVTAADLGNVPIAVVIPSSMTVLNVDQKNQLGNKLLEAVTASGMSGIGGPSGFELIPIVTITKEGQAGELRKFKIVTLNVALAIRQQTQNLAYASTSVVLSGSGQTKDDAITDAINTLAPDDDKLVALVQTGKTRIIDYYKTNCDAIRSDAKRRAGTGNTEEAIALLMSVPREAETCRESSARDAQALYVGYHERICQGLVRGARADVANHAFEAATDKLQKVDPASRCAKDADALLADIDQRVAKENDRSFQVKLSAIRVDREKVTKSIATPGGLATHQREATTGVAVDFMAKLPTRTHVIEDL
jgi:hypothetical protein